MTLNLQNTKKAKQKLENCDTSVFVDAGSSFRMFTNELKVNIFRNLSDVSLKFEHPVTVIAGTNKIGKTSFLLLLACSHEKFMKLDSTSPDPSLREHGWNDVLSFTSHENVDNDYTYEMKWRVGREPREGEGKRLATTRSWSGLGKRSSDASRMNAKIREREVRLLDLERVLPGRSFSNALYRKANTASKVRLDTEIEQAYSYVFDLSNVKIFEVGGHINKSCFLIEKSMESYSTFNAASGEESAIYLLKDIIGSPKDSLILIDEMEAGFHPSVQRKLADIVQYVSWRDKKQFVITTHSPTLLSAFPSKSRRFIERTPTGLRVIRGISHQAARSKMDSTGYPLVQLYCEDDLAAFLIRKVLVNIANQFPQFDKLMNIVKSGPMDQVKNDYERHKRNFPQYANKVGFCAVLDGDCKDNPSYSGYFANDSEKVLFLYPYVAPERFLVSAYLGSNPNTQLRSALDFSDHHSLFQTMVNNGLAADLGDARSQCYTAFAASPEFAKHEVELRSFLINVVTYFSDFSD